MSCSVIWPYIFKYHFVRFDILSASVLWDRTMNILNHYNPFLWDSGFWDPFGIKWWTKCSSLFIASIDYLYTKTILPWLCPFLLKDERVNGLLAPAVFQEHVVTTEQKELKELTEWNRLLKDTFTLMNDTKKHFCWVLQMRLLWPWTLQTEMLLYIFCIEITLYNIQCNRVTVTV